MKFQDFLQSTQTNKDLASKVENCSSIDELVTLAAKEGYAFSQKDIKEELMHSNEEAGAELHDNNLEVKGSYTRRG